MTVLASFLRSQRDAILTRFNGRMRESMAAGTSSGSQLADRIADFLAQLDHSLSAGVDSAETGRAKSSADPRQSGQGGLSLQVGLEVHSLVREYNTLQDCIFELLEELQCSPSLAELRALSVCISTAVAESVGAYTAAQQRSADAERRHLLELFQQAPGFVCFLRGRNMVFELANAAYLQLVGHRDILGKPVREALPEVEGQGFLELLDRVFVTGEPFIGRAMQVMLQREPGVAMSQALLDFIYQPIRSTHGEVIGILTQGVDVTQLKLHEAQHVVAEAALRSSDERYRTLFESIDDGFCILQIILDSQNEPVDYRFLETNAAFEGHTGLKDAVGKTALELVPDLDVSWFRLYGQVALSGETARFENHSPAMNRWFDVYANRVGDPALRQVALVFKDVSERKRIEQEREHLLASESKARLQAENASRLKDEFLATVSHELRTPLNAMLGWVQILRSGHLASDKIARALETIERNGRAQAKLIEDLLDVSRILAGKLRLHVEAVDVRSVVEAALETARPAADAKSIRLQATLDSDSIVMGDGHRLQQVVWNLLSNAVKFTPKGGRVQVLLEQRDSSVGISVTDTGQGIPKDFQPHVFERFRQADGSTTRMQGGLGLGLAIVRQLVELHGGTVSVMSEGEGKGASFTVTLPLAVTHRRAVQGSHDLQAKMRADGFCCPPELDSLHVLVVDDDEDTREMLRTLLETCGVRTRLAASVSAGLALFHAERPDLLLSDIGMPEEDGYAFIQQIRKLPREAGGEVPAVALTAYARTDDRTRALLSGFSSHVPKPVEPLELVAVIASLAGRTGGFRN